MCVGGCRLNGILDEGLATMSVSKHIPVISDREEQRKVWWILLVLSLNDVIDCDVAFAYSTTISNSCIHSIGKVSAYSGDTT